MNYIEPVRFAEQNIPLDNFSDLANRIRTKSTALNNLQILENCPYQLTVNINNADDLVMIVEQDYNLSKVLRSKYQALSVDPELLKVVLRLSSIYQSGIHINTPESNQYRNNILKHLHQL